jgi:hypothetical protein
MHSVTLECDDTRLTDGDLFHFHDVVLHVRSIFHAVVAVRLRSEDDQEFFL